MDKIYSPFVVQDGAVYLNQSFIGNGWINNAHIADGAVDNAKIQNAAISTAQIRDAAITSTKIQNAAIQNAHIANAAVDTLKIAGEAVTITRAASSSTGGTAAVSLYVPATEGPVRILGQIHGSGTMTGALRKDGPIQLTLGGNTAPNDISNCSAFLCYMDVSGQAGTFYLDATSGRITGCNLIAIGCKR